MPITPILCHLMITCAVHGDNNCKASRDNITRTRLQAAAIDDTAHPEPRGDCLGPGALAGVVPNAGFAQRSSARTSPWTCALWARVFGGPGQTDAGWPKRVSRRVQAAAIDDTAHPEPRGDCLGPGALAGVVPMRVSPSEAAPERRRGPVPCGPGFSGAWANRRRMAEKGVP